MAFPESSEPVLRFHNTSPQIDSAESDLELRISALEERIARISNRVEFSAPNGGKFLVLNEIIKISTKREELSLLAKALERVIPLLEEIEKYRGQVTVIHTAKENPSWFAATFGDLWSPIIVDTLAPDDLSHLTDE